MAPTNTNPSEGQKVDLGRNAPTTTEGPGAVAPDSLAAESSAFKSSNHVSQQNYSTEGSAPPKPHESGSVKVQSTPNTGNATNQHPAPTYVNSQSAQGDKSGPHGKNLTEDEELSGKNASFTEFGTKDDPARLAEQKFTSAPVAGNTGGAGREKTLDGKTQFDALGGDTSA